MDAVEQVPAVTYYPKTADASIEALRQLSGVVSLTRPVPKADFFEDEDEALDSDRPAARASD